MNVKNIWDTYIREHIGLSVVVAVGVFLVLVGLINYIRAYRSVSKGTSLVPPCRTTKRYRKKKNRMLPWPLYLGGVLLSVSPILLRFAELRYGFRLSEHLPPVTMFDSVLGIEDAEYRLAVQIFLISALVATVLLFAAYYRECRKLGWGFWKSIFVWVFTYNILTQLAYKLALSASENLFETPWGAPMLYAWAIYVYIALWSFFNRLLKN